MPLSIPGLPQPAGVENRSSTGLAHLNTGDVLEARIVEITTSGRTTLQFAGFRAVAEKPVAGGKMGDVLQFLVVPEENGNAERQQDHRLSTRLTQPGTASREACPGPSNHLQLRLLAFPEKALSAAPGKTSAPATSPGTSPSPSGPSAALPPVHVLLSSSLQVISAWVQRLDKMRPLSEGLEGRTAIRMRNHPQTPLENASARTLARLEMTDSKPLDRPGESWGNGVAVGFQLGQQPVNMKLQWRSKTGSNGDGAGQWTAIFVLNLEGSGALRVDLKMDPDRIHVGFWAENEAGRRRLAEALPELSSALAPLARQCSFQVAVSPGKIRDGDAGEEKPSKSARLDVRA